MMDYIALLKDYPHSSIAIGLLLAAAISYYSIPIILKVARLKGLYDFPNGRTSHDFKTPTLGGIAIYISVMITLILFNSKNSIATSQYIASAMTIIFFIGLKDDLLIISPFKKLIGQIIAVLILVIIGDIRIMNFGGILWQNEVPYLTSIILSLFVYLFIINAFNLIDGIDGLASGLAIISCGTFGFWFLTHGIVDYALFCAIVLGAIIPFFLFNMFGKKNKLFMGDTGSLIIGLLISIIAIQFSNYSASNVTNLNLSKAPIICFGILFIPLFDTFLVFLLRIIYGKSPFQADKTHIHHLTLKLLNSHKKSTFILLVINLITIIISFGMYNMGNAQLLIVLITIGIIYNTAIRFFVYRKEQKKLYPDKAKNA